MEFEDWEVVPHSDLEAVSDEIEADSGGMIRFELDHFSLPNDTGMLDNTPAPAPAPAPGVDVESSVDSNNPSWIDPARYESNTPVGFWSDSSTDRWSSSDGIQAPKKEEEDVVVTNESKLEDEFSSLHLGENNKSKDKDLSNLSCEAVTASNSETERKQDQVGWWKLPLELLKFCLFRVSPVWTFSTAAAVMGFVILGRRLYKMNRKAKSLQLKVTVDDKKVSQFMIRAARLNEAFSVARRVPIVRPMLPTAGVTPWPVMNVR